MRNERERKVDRLSGIGWMIFGAVVAVHAMTMETREYLGATFLTGPGLVPGMIGAAIFLLGGVLFLRGRGGGAIAFIEEVGPDAGRRAAIALALMLVYGIGLIGRIPFGIATFLFVSAFVVAFNLPVADRRGLAILAVKALATGALTALAVSFVFQTVFLVRLP